jgi:hypothetical protein
MVVANYASNLQLYDRHHGVRFWFRFTGNLVMLDIETNVKIDERGFLYLEYLGKRLMTFRGERKLILRKLIRQIQEEVANESVPSN